MYVVVIASEYNPTREKTSISEIARMHISGGTSSNFRLNTFAHIVYINSNVWRRLFIRGSRTEAGTLVSFLGFEITYF